LPGCGPLSLKFQRGKRRLAFVDVIGTKIREGNVVFSVPEGFYPTPGSTIV